MPDARRILFVNNFPGPEMGGGEVLLLHVLRGCIAAGWRATVLCPPGVALAEKALAAGAEVHSAEMRLGRLRGLMREIRRLGAEASVVVGTGYFTNVLVRLAARGLTAHIVNIVQTEPGALLAGGGSRLALAVRRLVDRLTRDRVDAFVAVSHSVMRALQRAGVPRDRIRVVHNGVDVVSLRAKASLELDAQLPPGEGPLVGCVARLERVKGVADFLDAAARIVRVRPEARFVVAGSGTQAASLAARSARLPGGSLAFLGHVHPVEPLMARLDVLVLPSRSEALGIVLLEAAALGVPVVATRVGGVPEAVSDGVTGILVSPRDPGAIAEAVLSLLADPVRAREMGEAGRERVEMAFTVERMVAGHLEVYGELLGR